MITTNEIKEKLEEISDCYVDEYENIKEQADFFKKNESHISDCFTDTLYAIKENFSEEERSEHEDLQNRLESMIVKKVYELAE